MERDLRTILYIQALRASLYGFSSVVIGTTLSRAGYSSTRVGLVFTSMLGGMAVTSILLGRYGHRFQKRTLYGFAFIVLGIAGSVFAFTTRFIWLLAAGLTGTLSTDPNESGPITSLEQAMLGGSPANLRARVFGRYNAVAYLAGSAGSLFAGGPELLRGIVPALPKGQRFLFAFPLIALLCLLLTARLSSQLETPAPERRPLHESKTVVRRLSVLFALDAGGGGFVVQSFMVFWFETHFGATATTMGAVFFAAGILQAFSSIAAGWLAQRIGFLNTMVFTHLPSNVLLISIAFMPNLTLGIVALLMRFALSQMDVPARQAYVSTLVQPHERTAAAAYTNTARYVVRPLGAAGAGSAMDRLAAGAPFIAGGALKIVYDAAIYMSFRRVKFPD